MDIPENLRAFKRTAYHPQTIDGDGPPTASKFGGTPWPASNEDWPRCEVCGSPLQFFMQLALDGLPVSYGNGLLTGIRSAKSSARGGTHFRRDRGSGSCRRMARRARSRFLASSGRFPPG